VRQSPGLSVCGEAEDGVTGIQKFDSLKPDVVLLDLSLPDITGLEAARLMTSADPTVPLILFTILQTEGLEDAAKQAGIRAIVPKTEAWDLISKIKAEVSRPN
jgi:two-component system, chemotaxis family, chemotaxis protein CheY